VFHSSLVASRSCRTGGAVDGSLFGLGGAVEQPSPKEPSNTTETMGIQRRLLLPIVIGVSQPR